MMDVDLKELASRVEAATGASRGLDAEIAKAVGTHTITGPIHPFNSPNGFYEGPHYTASLDAAMSLVPDFPHLVLVKQLWNGPGTEDGKSTLAIINRYGATMWTGDFSGLAATPALALSAAALRARENSDERT